MSSIAPWPSGIRIMATSTRWSRRPVTPQPLPFDRGSPFEFEAQLDEKGTAASSDSTTMPTLSIPLKRHVAGVSDGGFRMVRRVRLALVDEIGVDEVELAVEGLEAGESNEAIYLPVTA